MPSSKPEPKTPWPHAPTHQLATRGTYFVTAATLDKAHHFRSAPRLQVLHRGLLTVAERFGWQLEAWAVFSNHYHFVAHSPPTAADASSLSGMLSMLHVKTAEWVNKLDATPGRQVWFNFWDTRLTHQRSFLTRLNYVHQNAVKHGLVPVACQYPWCSAAWFERTASPEGRVRRPQQVSRPIGQGRPPPRRTWPVAHPAWPECNHVGERAQRGSGQ